jgi:hypothetical protein
LKQTVNRVFGTLNRCLDATIPAIADPSIDAPLPRFALRVMAEPNALNASENAQVECHSHDVLCLQSDCRRRAGGIA